MRNSPTTTSEQSRARAEEKAIALRHLTAARRRALATLRDHGPVTAEDIAEHWRRETPLTARASLIGRLLWVLESLEYAETATEANAYRITELGERALDWF